MKKITLILILLISSINFVNAQYYVGSYKGLMDEITMKGKPYKDVSDQVFNLTTDMLVGTVSKIGNMPGTISIELSIKVDENGTITPTSQNCGRLDIIDLFPINLELTSLTGATVVGNTLEFTLKCHGTYFGVDFPASVHFKSKTFTQER